MHAKEYLVLGALLLTGYLTAKFAQRFLAQSAMVGYMLAGVLLSVLMHWMDCLNPQIVPSVYPKEFAGFVSILAGFGLTLYQASCGTHITRGEGESDRRTYWGVMVCCIVSPLIGGGILGWVLYPQHSFPEIPRFVFAGMTGLCLSLTSIVAISLSLGEFGLKKSRVGSIALKAATTEDGLAWFLLAIVLAFLPTVGSTNVWLSLLYVCLFVGGMWCVVRPLLETYMPRDLHKRDPYALYFIILIFVASISEALGLHALFGAMLLGMILPRTDNFASKLEDRLKWTIEELFVPLFLLNSSMKCDFSGFGLDVILLTVVVVLVATATKLGAGALAARFIGGKSWRESAVIGIAMNTRGLMTLMLLVVAQDHHIMSPTMYTVLVLQALATTAMTSWGLHLVQAGKLAPPHHDHPHHPRLVTADPGMNGVNGDHIHDHEKVTSH